MQKLNLPEYKLRIRKSKDHLLVFDVVRKKWMRLTPEEWVRQNFIHHLVHALGFPFALIAVEAGFKVEGLSKRSDILLYNRRGKAVGMVECKAADVPINQAVFDQIVRYNMGFKVPYLLLTNGMKHYCCVINYETQNYRFLKDFPSFTRMMEETDN